MEQTVETPQKKNKTATIVVVAIVAAALSLILMITGFFTLVFSVLDKQKDSPEYKVAYEYLVSSEAFNELSPEPDQIRFNSFRISTVNGESTATVGFTVNGRSFEVVCHKEDGRWIPCRECTKFQ